METHALVLDSAKQHLKKLAPLAKQLNEATDAFTEELRAINAELAKLAIGIDVQRPWMEPIVSGDVVKDDADRETWLRSYLAYGRHGKAWTLLVRTYECRNEGVEPGEYDIDVRVLISETPLLDATREERMAAAEQIEKLLEQITEAATRKVESLRKVTDKE